MEPQQLQSRLDEYLRYPLAKYPSALEEMPRLGKEVNRRLYVKRDDELGVGMGGNKTRKLEYLIAEALERGYTKVATFGGLQSNHARLTAAAACRAGLETHLFYFQRQPERLTGNLLLNHILGAQMHFIPLGGDGGGMSLETTIWLVRILARAMIGKHYFIPVGGHCWRGCLGYVQAAMEIDCQARQLGLENACLVVAAGSGGTLAGLMAGLALIDSSIRVVGVDVGKLWKGFPASIAVLAGEICTHLGEARQFEPTQVPLVEGTYVGAAYGAPSPAGLWAMHQTARLEGLLLDPVYTAKAMAGLLDLNQLGRLGSHQSPLIFLHTGGVPALFAFDEQVLFSKS